MDREAVSCSALAQLADADIPDLARAPYMDSLSWLTCDS